MESRRHLIFTRDNLLLRSYIQFRSLQSFSIRPSINRRALSHQSRSFAKGKGQRSSKKCGTSGTYARPTAPAYSYGKSRIDNKSIFGSRPKLFSKWELASFVLFAVVLAVQYAISKRSHSGPDPEAQLPQDGAIIETVLKIHESFTQTWEASPPQEGVSLETLSKKHESYTETWKASAEYGDLVSFFKETVLRNNSVKITTCMNLCLGSLSGPSWTTEHNGVDHAMSQLVAFESMVELLREFMQPRIRGSAIN